MEAIFSQLGEGFLYCLQPSSILVMLCFTIIGIIFGSIPGLSATMAVSLFLPLTFAMEAKLGFSLLIALYIGAISGGLIAAILLNIPGTPSSIVTCFDGHPMAKKGEAGKALGMGIVYSFLGGLLSFVALIFLAPSLADVALRFSPIEYFSVCVLALAMITTISTGNFLVGVLAGMFGLMLATTGLSPIDGIPRYSLGIENLTSGFDIVPAMIGIFAISEALGAAERINALKEAKTLELKPIKGFGFTLIEFAEQKWNYLRSSIIGTCIGILPGIGGSTSSFLAYIAAKSSSKNPESFGTGNPAGVVASESANNATIGGALIPLLALGIPGDSVTAVLLGGFMIHGLTPGPLLFINSVDLVYSVFAACLVVNVMMLCVEFYFIRGFVRLLLVPKYILMPIILVMCTVGAYALNNRLFDVQSIFYFGIVGYLMSKFRVSVAPLILGFILGNLVETNLLRGMMMTDGSFIPFLTRPLSGFFLAVTVILLMYSIIKELRRALQA